MAVSQIDTVRTSSYSASDFIQCTKCVHKTTFRWDKKKTWKASALIGMGGVLYWKDEQIRRSSIFNQNKIKDDIAFGAEKFGNPLYTTLGVASFVGVGAITKNQRLKNLSIEVMEVFVLSTITNQVIKNLANRHRPRANNGAYEWDGPTIGGDNKSFFSGHTTAAFGFATVFAEEYKETNPWVPYIAYSAASLTALSRIYDDAHWSSDVFFGAALGYFYAKIVHKFHSSKKGYTLIPMPSEGGVSLVFSIKI